jgi:pyrimidine operon attenuation protein / uracil phosphoribosyltransferase
VADPVLLDAASIDRGLRRVAGAIAERGRGVGDLCLVGIRRGGEPLAKRLAELLKELEGADIPVGSLDITLYRDDAATALPNPLIGPSNIPFDVGGKRVVLVDDVLYTGRTIRAAVDALLDYGRPRRIELVALVDRGGRELPIQPDYVVRTVEVGANSRVEVQERAGQDGPELCAVVVASPSATGTARREGGT